LSRHKLFLLVIGGYSAIYLADELLVVVKMEVVLLCFSDVNDQMEACSNKGSLLGFLDNHESFKDQSTLYYKDGLHLSDEGSKKLAIAIRTRIEVFYYACFAQTKRVLQLFLCDLK